MAQASAPLRHPGRLGMLLCKGTLIQPLHCARPGDCSSQSASRLQEKSQMYRRVFGVPAAFLLTVASISSNARSTDEKPAATGPVSFYRQVRPILQRSCTGCHQPAKAGGKLVLTSYAGTKAGGEQGAGFEAGKPDDSLLVEFISGEKPAMPKNA